MRHWVQSPRRQPGVARRGNGARSLLLCSLAATIWFASPVHAAPKGAPDLTSSFRRDVQPFLDQHCSVCHSRQLRTADVVLETGGSVGAEKFIADRYLWKDTQRKIVAGEMPPAGQPRPEEKELRAVLAWIDTRLASPEPEAPVDPGRVTARRLNRAEYNNTIRDLFGIDIRPADDFPVDDTGFGFDTIGDVLTIAPVHMERYVAAAEQVVQVAIPVPHRPRPTSARLFAPRGKEPEQLRDAHPEVPFTEDGSFHVRHEFPYTGEYVIAIRAHDRRPEACKKDSPVRFAAYLDDRKVAEFERDPSYSARETYDVEVTVPAGTHRVDVEFLPGRWDLLDRDEDGMRMLAIGFVEVRGPYRAQTGSLPESFLRVYTCGDPAAGEYPPGCEQEILGKLARRAYRRPVTQQEIDHLAGFVEMAREEGESFEAGVQTAVKAMLVSPQFLFRLESDPVDLEGGQRLLSQHELASRLSYFLWSSMPDEELFDLAGNLRLHDRDVLEDQVRRMMRDPKGRAFSENFAGQWLELRNLERVTPDPERFSEFDPALRQAMRRETELFFDYVLREDRSVLDFIDGPYTFLNDRLARHYGIEGIQGSEFRRVDLDGGQRSGLLTQGSVLTVSSYPTRTSPVLRGKWLLENILGSPPPPPPADVAELDETKVGTSGTLREQLEQHRANPTCAVCHDRIDPLGFGLENYNAIGGWRTHQGSFPVDSTGTLPGGKSFEGPAGLKEILRGKKDEFTRALTEKVLTYALGRGIERSDRPVVERIVSRVAEDNYRFRRLVTEVAASEPFRMRRGEGGEP